MEAINIHSEIRKLIADCVQRGEARTVASYVDIVMADHSAIEGDDADFYLVCTRARIKDIVSKTIGKFQPKAQASDRQLVLDGFEHLQVAYTFERGGETILIPVNQCSDIELLRRAAEYDDMANGCRAHSRELREYVEARTETGAAA